MPQIDPTQRPFSQACENNKAFILEKLGRILCAGDSVLEIGSGTAQHVLHFAAALPDTRWQPTELAVNLPTLQAGLAGLATANIAPPAILDVRSQWPTGSFNAVYSANCLHIMSAACVELFFAGLPALLAPAGQVCVYGPFNYNGRFTSDSNASFEQWLKARDPQSGIRDFEWVVELARQAGLELLADHAMPANNRLLHWRLHD